jgi:hypothetical protein
MRQEEMATVRKQDSQVVCFLNLYHMPFIAGLKGFLVIEKQLKQDRLTLFVIGLFLPLPENPISQ